MSISPGFPFCLKIGFILYGPREVFCYERRLQLSVLVLVFYELLVGIRECGELLNEKRTTARP